VISLFAKLVELILDVAAAREQRRREERAAEEAYERALREELEGAERRRKETLN
jgi:hypothetical protein